MKSVTRVVLYNDKIYVSFANGEYYAQPLTNPWLWVIGAICDGTPISVFDNREFLEEHQHNLSCEIKGIE